MMMETFKKGNQRKSSHSQGSDLPHSLLANMAAAVAGAPPPYSTVFNECFGAYDDEEIVASTGCERDVLWFVWNKYS